VTGEGRLPSLNFVAPIYGGGGAEFATLLMKNQAFFLLALVIFSTAPALAILPENSRAPLLPLSEKGITFQPAGTSTSLSRPPERRPRRNNWTHKTAGKIGAYRQFTAKTGRKWAVRWNRRTGTPRMVAMLPYKIDIRGLNSHNVEAVCRRFVADNAELLGAEPQQLRLLSGIKAGGHRSVVFQQVHKDVPVLGGQLKMFFTSDDRLVMLSSEIYPDVTVDTEPDISSKQAITTALRDCGQIYESDEITAPQLCIVPLYRPDAFEYRLCWRLYVNRPAIPRKWQYLIDAHTGAILGRINVLVYQNVSGTARLEYKPEFASDPTQVDPFAHGQITAMGPEVVIASWNLDSDPGWATEGQWAFGQPAGNQSAFSADPNSGYTGSNVYGYNLYGDYEDNMPAFYLTSSPVDCSAYDNVYLRFMRWLAVESYRFDKATVEASNDGHTWTEVWSNPNEWLIDHDWVAVNYDISKIAAHQNSVYIRWAMGPTDSSVTFAGWNIDDVSLIYRQGGVNRTTSHSDGTYSVLLPTSPATIKTELKGSYCDIDYACGVDALIERKSIYGDTVFDFTWDNNSYNEIVEPSVYRHINFVHDYFTSVDPNLSAPTSNFPNGLDYTMPVTVQKYCATGFCNAYWDGEGIVLGAGDGQLCDDFGLYSEVVYHEYTHAVTSKIYSGIYFPYVGESGALNEAWSDYFGSVLSPSQSPLVGEGGLLTSYPDGVRSLDNNYRRETDFSNEAHFDSQILSGALWLAREKFRQRGEEEIWDEMVHFAKYSYPQDFEQYLQALLMEDDLRYGDANLANGSPHSKLIFSAFGDHGIGGLQYLPGSIVIDDSAGNINGRLEPSETAKLSLSLDNGWADATMVSAKLFTNDRFVEIIKANAGFPNAAYGDIVDNSSDPFVIRLAPDCPRTHTINFRLEITAHGPYTYKRTSLFTYPVAVNQLAYDDGQEDKLYVGYGASGGALAVYMTPDRYPCYLTHVRLFPYPDMNSTVTVAVWDDNGPNGLPGSILGAVQADIKGTGNWFDVSIVSLGLRIDSGSFYVGWIEGENRYYNALDMDPPYYDRSWVHFVWPGGQQWDTLSDLGYLVNLMVRVKCLYDIGEGPVENASTGKRYHTIQAAIDDADDGDVIIIAQGRYEENIDFLGKAITLSSTSPNNPAVVASTVIYGNGLDPVVSFNKGEGRDSILQGLTITGPNNGLVSAAGLLCNKLDQAGPMIINCRIVANPGPGIRSVRSSPIVANCIIAENKTDGIELRAASTAAIVNCTITRNGRFGLFWDHSIKKKYSPAPLVRNCIIWDNKASQVKAAANITYSDIQGGWPGLGNINVDPCFVDPAGSNFHLKSQGWRWDQGKNQWTWDEVTSRCIDAGNPGTDLADEPLTLDVDPLNRFGWNLRINMGAYGGTAQASMPPHRWALRADSTNDGVVDFAELKILEENWLSGGKNLAVDFDRNGFIDMADFALLADEWLDQTSWFR